MSCAARRRHRGGLLHLAAVGDPVPVGEGRDFHARAAEVAVVHAPERNRVPVRWSGGRTGGAARAPGARRAPVGGHLARHDVGGSRRAARQPHAQPGRGAFDVAASAVLGPRSGPRLLQRLGPVVRASASESRSQARNRQLALDRLAAKLNEGLTRRAHPPPHPAHEELAGAPGGGEAPSLPDQAGSPSAGRGRLTACAQSANSKPSSAAPSPESSRASSSASSSAHGPRRAVRAA